MEGTIRLNKYLSDAGVCSRREADRLVEEGKVRVDGEIAGRDRRWSVMESRWARRKNRYF